VTSDTEDDEPSCTISIGAELTTLLEEDDNLTESGALDGTGIRTKHETSIDMEPVDLSHVSINPSAAIEQLGVVEKKMGAVVIVRAYTDGEYRVLDEGAIVVTESREIFGTVFCFWRFSDIPDLRDIWTSQEPTISCTAIEQALQ
jgi:H/ACA ribonucleoprotein complex non-core subunit NAF1